MTVDRPLSLFIHKPLACHRASCTASPSPQTCRCHVVLWAVPHVPLTLQGMQTQTLRPHIYCHHFWMWKKGFEAHKQAQWACFSVAPMPAAPLTFYAPVSNSHTALRGGCWWCLSSGEAEAPGVRVMCSRHRAGGCWVSY